MPLDMGKSGLWVVVYGVEELGMLFLLQTMPLFIGFGDFGCVYQVVFS